MKFEPTLHKLSNGLTVILDPMDIETVNMKFSAQTGGRDESELELGITHFLEHIFMKGTSTHPSPRSIKNFIENNAGTINASTGNSSVQIYGRILSQNLFVLVELISDLLKNSLFNEKVIENEKKVILDEYRRSRDDKNTEFFYFQVENLFNGSGFSHRTLGAPETIQSFTRDQLLKYKDSRISANNSAISISGKIIDSEALLEKLENLFSWLPSFEVSTNSDAIITPASGHNLKPEQKNVMLKICFSDIWEKTFENRFRQQCVGRFGGVLSRRLHDKVRNENGLVYGIWVSDIGNENTKVNNIYTTSAAENLEKIVALCANASVEILNNKLITQEELTIDKTIRLLGNADFLESADKRSNRLLNFYRKYGKLYDFYDVVKMGQSTTLDDVYENAKDYFKNPVGILTQGPEFNIDLKAIWEDNFK
ncbi:MAG: insulinase family protein [Alphaproteobacteria bacterium]|nr:insulinase family protein [Alphaproteobacteria bacterium]MBN2674883.1 insulinase family protein [Alphaproteobacteria bacterium]